MIWMVHSDKDFIVEGLGHVVSPHLPFGELIRLPISLQSHDSNHTADHLLTCFSQCTSFPHKVNSAVKADIQT